MLRLALMASFLSLLGTCKLPVQKSQEGDRA